MWLRSLAWNELIEIVVSSLSSKYKCKPGVKIFNFNNRKKRSINAKSSIEFNTNNQGAVQASFASEEKAIETAADATSLGIEMIRFVNKDIVIGIS